MCVATGTVEPTSEADPIQVSTSEYASPSSQAATIVTSSPGLTTFVSEEVIIDDPVIVTTSEEVTSSAVENEDEEGVEVLVQDDTGDMLQIPATQEIVQEVEEVMVMRMEVIGWFPLVIPYFLRCFFFFFGRGGGGGPIG